MVSAMARQAEENLPPVVSGILELIPDIANLGEIDEEKYAKSLFNAENLTITADGWVFVTGSLDVCEIVKIGNVYQLKKIPIETSDGSRKYFRNGIAAQGNSLYLACPHIHKREKSFFPDLLGDIRKKDQNRYGLLLIGINKWDLGYQVDSYILRADLKNRENMKFTDEIPLPKKGKCFANGLDSDGKALYVANSYANFIHQNYFYKLLLSDNGEITEVKSIGFSPPNYDSPNGLKFRSEKDGDYLYYTCVQQFPIMTSSLKRIKIYENTGSVRQAEAKVEEAEIIYQSRFSFFDDFDIVDNGFVITDIAILPQCSSCLRFVSKDNRKLIGTFRHKNLIKPSSVKVVNKKTEYFEKGDVLITEKGLHCVSRLRPDDEMRDWLIPRHSNQRR